tara:strand:- start:12728 stop:13195 length:468 start_codon:yes stop_codon:yes gene_type:complete
MIDPATAITAASFAFNAIKKSCQIGRDLEGMAGDLGRWSKAISDFDFAAKRIENPKWYQSFGNVEQQAMELFVQKKQRENMRDDLRKMISETLGPSAWQELIRMENEIRQKQKDAEYKRIERKDAVIAWAAGIFLFLLCVGALFGFVWIAVRRDG